MFRNRGDLKVGVGSVVASRTQDSDVRLGSGGVGGELSERDVQTTTTTTGEMKGVCAR